MQPRRSVAPSSVRTPSRGAAKATQRRRPSQKGAGRPRGAVSEETRARIIDAACRCFADRGYSTTSNQDIARAAGLTTGALYHYFESKAELFAAVHRQVHDTLVGVYRRAFEEERTCVDQLCAGLEAALAVTSDRPAVAHFAATASLEIERRPELGEILTPDTQAIRRFFAQLLAAGRERGEIAAEVDTEAVVDLVLSSLFGLVWLRSQVRHRGQYEAAIRAFQHLLRGALFCDRGSPRKTPPRPASER